MNEDFLPIPRREQDPITELVEEVVRTDQRMTITHDGEPVAVLMSVEDYDQLIQAVLDGAKARGEATST